MSVAVEREARVHAALLVAWLGRGTIGRTAPPTLWTRPGAHHDQVPRMMPSTALTSLLFCVLLLAPVQCEAIPRIHSLFEQPPAPEARSGGVSHGAGRDARHAHHQAAGGAPDADANEARPAPAPAPPDGPAVDHAPAIVSASIATVGEAVVDPAAPRFPPRADAPHGLADGPEPPPPKPRSAARTSSV